MPRGSSKVGSSAAKKGGEYEHHDNDAVSVASSVGSRSSLRLKRKREGATAAKLTMRSLDLPVPEEDKMPVEQDEEQNNQDDDDPMDQTPTRGSKRRKQSSTAVAKSNLPNDDNDVNDDVEDDDSKPPASIRVPHHHSAVTDIATVTTTTTTTTTLNGQSASAPLPLSATAAAAATAATAASLDTPPTTNRPVRASRRYEGGRLNLNAAASEATPFKSTRKINNRPPPLNGNEVLLPTVDQHPSHNDNEEPQREPHVASVAPPTDATPAAAAAEPERAAIEPYWWNRFVAWCVYNYGRLVHGGGGGEQKDPVANEDANGKDDAANDSVAPLWVRTSTWFLLLLVLQVVFFPLWLNPILSSTVTLSKICLTLYQGMLGVSSSSSLKATNPAVLVPDVVKGNTSVAVPLNLQTQILAAVARVDQWERELHKAHETSRVLRSEYEAKMPAHKGTMDDDTVLEQRQARLDELLSLVDQLEVLLSLPDKKLLRNPLVSTMAQLLTTLSVPPIGNATMPPPLLLDLAPLELWPLPTKEEMAASMEATECLPADSNNDTLLDGMDITTLRAELQAQADAAAIDITENADRILHVQSWIIGRVQDEMAKWQDLVSQSQAAARQEMLNQSSSTPPDDTASWEHVRRLVTTRLLEKTRSSDEETRRFDYAMIWNGGAVLAASPSLVEELPLLNRMAAALRLRFYGYGPTAALTPPLPSRPTTAASQALVLGQCWAFVPRALRTAPTRDGADMDGGLFGFLTIRLARPIYIESVVVEHPSPEVSDQWRTAIRRFKVVGYERSDDNATAWPLGSFEYQMNRGSEASVRQEFGIEVEDLPVISVVRLEIDSNWGADYSCLYRFRVHGFEHFEDAEDEDDDNDETDEE
jgi:Sad1 / UNC-like C-terminal